MNQSFDLSRLTLLISKHWSENRKKYLLTLVALFGLMLICFGFAIMAEYTRTLDDGFQLGVYYFGLALAGCVYGSMLFADLASKSRGINYLMLPASHLEKLVCNLFFAIVVFFCCYTLMFYVVDAIMVNLSNAIAFHYWEQTHNSHQDFSPEKVMNVFVMPKRQPGEPNIFFYFLIAYFAVQSAFIAGSIYFPKFSFIKTVISVLLAAIAVAFFTAEVLRPLMPAGGYFNGITGYYFAQGYNLHGVTDSFTNTGKVVQLPEWISTMLIELVKYAFIPIFWVVAFFRLKEKEV